MTVFDLAWLPDSSSILSASLDKTVSLWDVRFQSAVAARTDPDIVPAVFLQLGQRRQTERLVSL